MHPFRIHLRKDKFRQRLVTINVTTHMHKAISIRCRATHVFPGAQTDDDEMFSNFTVFHQRLEISSR